MSTYREITYAVINECKTISDDSLITPEFVLYLATKYRNYIINANYLSQRKAIPDSYYQTICFDLELDPISNTDVCGVETMLKSTTKIPLTMTLGHKLITSPMGFNYGNINLVSYNKFKYVGFNKFLRNQIYATIGPDGYLYLKSNTAGFEYLKGVSFTAIFEDPIKASELECLDRGEKKACDIWDKNFPIEEAFVSTLIQAVTKDVLGAAWRPADDTNNASDDLSDVSNFIRQNMKKDYNKTLNGDN